MSNRDGETPDAVVIPEVTEDGVRAYIAMYGLSVPDDKVRPIAEAVDGSLQGIPSLWSYDLSGVDTAVAIPTVGRR